MTRFTLLEILTTLQLDGTVNGPTTRTTSLLNVRDVFLTQTVKNQLGREKDIPLICFVNEESMVSGIEHLPPGTNNNGTLVFSLLYVCEEKQKE